MAYDYVKLACPYCEFSSKQESRFRQHLIAQHRIEESMMEGLYVLHIMKQQKPSCGCGCGKPLPWGGWKKGYTSKYLRGHNATIDTCFAKPEIAKMLAEKRRGKPSWNKGLTKETSEKIATMSENISKSLQRGYQKGTIVDWHIKDPKKALHAAVKSSATKKQRYASGEVIPWNKGLTKDSSKTLELISKNISHTTRLNQDSSARRFTPLEVQTLLTHVIDKKFQLLSPLLEYRNRHQTLEFLCLICNTVQQKSLQMMLTTPVCFTCHPKSSKAQLELYEFVKTLCPDAVLNDRSVLNGKELDVWVPSARLGIEYNGLYYHSEKFLSNNYHSEKLFLARSLSVKLMNIFEDQWRDKQDIVKSMISSKLGKTPVTVHARKCTVLALTPKDRRAFFLSAHIDGDANSTVAFGLLYEGKIVSALSLRRAFHKRYGNLFEIGRFASAPFHNVVGGMSKLVSRAKEYAKMHGKVGLMSYVDLNNGDGHSYEKIGFKLVSETKERFWWTDYDHRINRFAIRADKPNGITQKQRADELGVVKIWGCGNKVYQDRFV